MHDSRCCKLFLSYSLAKGVSYSPKLQSMILEVANHFFTALSFTYKYSSASFQIMQTTSHLPSSKGESYPTRLHCMTSDVANHFTPPIRKSEFYPPKHLCMTIDVANHLFPSNLQGGSLTHPNFSARLQMLQATSLLTICKGGVLPNKNAVLDSRCRKPILSCPSTRGEFCPPKLQCMTPNVATHFYPIH